MNNINSQSDDRDTSLLVFPSPKDQDRRTSAQQPKKKKVPSGESVNFRVRIARLGLRPRYTYILYVFVCFLNKMASSENDRLAVSKLPSGRADWFAGVSKSFIAIVTIA